MAAHLTDSVVVAHLSWQTVVVRVTDLDADTAVTSLADGTGVCIVAGQTALVSDAHMSRWTLIRSSAHRRYANATLLRYWVAFETGRASAGRYVAVGLAE